jgi:hypothetical protein
MKQAMPPPPFDLRPPPNGQELIAGNEFASAIQPSLRDQLGEAKKAWLAKSPSKDTKINYECDLKQFLATG